MTTLVACYTYDVPWREEHGHVITSHGFIHGLYINFTVSSIAALTRKYT